MMIRLISFFLLLANICFGSIADSTIAHFTLGIRGDYGFVIAHRPALRPLQEEHVKGFEISIARISHGKNSWEHDFLLPEKGVTLAIFNLGNPERLGYGFAIYPYLDFPLSKKETNKLIFRYGIGLGWVEKVFDSEKNYKNAAIGSHLNGVIHFDLHYETELTKKSRLEIAAAITHYSNGAYELPNLGINIPTFNLAYTRFIGEKRLISHQQYTESLPNSSWNVYIGGGVKKIYPPQGKQYTAGVLSVLRSMPIKTKASWGLGADIFYDNSLSARLKNSEATLKGTSDDLRLGFYGAYEIHAGKTGLLFNMGYYAFTRWKGDGNIYHRLGIRQYFNKVFLCMNLKTHYARADFIEFGIGYKL